MINVPYLNSAVYRTGSFTTTDAGLAWWLSVLTAAGWTLAQTWTSAPGAGILMVGDSHQLPGSKVKVAIRDYSTGSGGDMYHTAGLNGPYLPNLSVEVISYDEERGGPKFVCHCSGRTIEIFACPANFATALKGISAWREPYMAGGASMQVGIPRQIAATAGTDCPETEATESWYGIADAAWIDGGYVGGVSPIHTLRERWMPGAASCYVYGYQGLGPFWHVAGAYGGGGYGTVGWDDYGAPKIVPGCVEMGYDYNFARTEKDWTRDDADNSIPFYRTAELTYGTKDGKMFLQGPMYNAAWSSIPNYYRRASNKYDLSDPLGRILPKFFNDTLPGQVYSDCTLSPSESMGSLVALKMDEGAGRCYVNAG